MLFSFFINLVSDSGSMTNEQRAIRSFERILTLSYKQESVGYNFFRAKNTLKVL